MLAIAEGVCAGKLFDAVFVTRGSEVYWHFVKFKVFYGTTYSC